MADDEPQAPLPGGSQATPVVGPVLGAILGLIVLKLLPGETPIWLGVAIVIVTLVVVTYASIEFQRWKRRTGR